MRDDKISFDDLIKSGDVLPNEVYDKQDVFIDSPRKFDFTILILIVLSLSCIIFTFVFYYNNTEPIDETACFSTISVDKEISVSSKAEVGIININTASTEELCKLKNIGEKRALSIISYRTANGPFEKIEDLLNVNGIGEGIFKEIKDKICV